MKNTVIALGTLFALGLSTSVLAGASSTITATSNYSYNGYSQTENEAALQGSLDYGWDNGIYIGTFASNVGFNGFGTDVEWDAYVGKYTQLNDTFGLDAGISVYTYYGESAASDLNYNEVYSQLDITSDMGVSNIRAAYAWDYFGYDVEHIVTTLAHTFEVADGHSLKLTYNYSYSFDEAKWPWGNNNKSYDHFKVSYLTNYKGFDFDISAEDTSINHQDETKARVIFTVSRTFSF
ncbi:hypothetical protein SOPP22_09925 [Shewanella sp. OPT22]|nr:hypothetical protein SOPP22_09925 [Shewanella sp. OPT22]